MQASLSNTAEADAPTVSVIVPARNEEACLGACLQSLVEQSGVNFEIIVVDDDSTDRTFEIARSFSNVNVIKAGPLPYATSGKSSALYTAALQASGQWLLFTDADTVHLPGSLARALAEAKQHGNEMLSYSPAQELHGPVQRAVMPVIFAELASTYRPREVSDPKSSSAAANGQYVLITRRAYESVGGHAALGGSLLEDVELARAVKSSGYKIRFRFGGDAVRTRMYRGFPDLVEGWTKNLVLLFPRAVSLCILRSLEFLAIALGLTAFAVALIQSEMELVVVSGIIVALIYSNFLLRIRKAHAGMRSTALSLMGLPIFSYLLLRSQLYYKWHRKVTWKGRQYSTEMRNLRNEAPNARRKEERWSI
jgi:glycosyltransferase involved in cell wall biosynthesis